MQVPVGHPVLAPSAARELLVTTEVAGIETVGIKAIDLAGYKSKRDMPKGTVLLHACES